MKAKISLLEKITLFSIPLHKANLSFSNLWKNNIKNVVLTCYLQRNGKEIGIFKLRQDHHEDKFSFHSYAPFWP